MKLGDTHNFGNYVQFYDENWISKPRSVLWEELFLSKVSPLRKLIIDFSSHNSALNPFDVIPNLNFKITNDYNLIQNYKEPLLLNRKLSECEVGYLGAFLSLMTWFGISDLHKENVKIGFNRADQLEILPLDIETPFCSHILPSETWLIPPITDNVNICGFDEIKKLINVEAKFIKSFIKSYLDFYLLLEKNAIAIESYFLCDKQISNEPIRVILRNTNDYQLHLENKIKIENLLYEEENQLLRNEIPYFFRKLSEPNEVYYFGQPNVSQAVDKNNPLIQLTLEKISKRPFLRPSKEQILSCLEAGGLEILDWLCQQTDSIEYEDTEFSFRKNKNNLLIHYKKWLHVETDI
ncbi:MAG: hypothetical protein KDD40_05905 [Bdellovibrionales bacterium]|nr:hypothetical protein [Bdellovibrionales bacterium]